jgi:pimeloyl-ACP methyl ester carboxylesterase
MIDIGGYRLHLNCTGDGSPAVILESGAGASSNIWAHIQPELARSVCVCSYDRAGFAWSDARPITIANPDPIRELADLLRIAAIRPPFILVGHSLGGELVRIYAREHPRDTVGMVLIATGHPDTSLRNPVAENAQDNAPQRMLRLFALFSRIGLLRVMPQSLIPGMFREYMGLLRTLGPAGNAELTFLQHAKYLDAIAEEMSQMRQIDRRGRIARDFDDLPLTVISEKWVFSDHPDEQELQSARIEDELQTEMAQFSHRGKRVVIDGGHLIPITRPRAVIEAVHDILNELRTR